MDTLITLSLDIARDIQRMIDDGAVVADRIDYQISLAHRLLRGLVLLACRHAGDSERMVLL